MNEADEKAVMAYARLMCATVRSCTIGDHMRTMAAIVAEHGDDFAERVAKAVGEMLAERR